MTLLIDNALSPQVANLLREAGYVVRRVELSCSGTADWVMTPGLAAGNVENPA